MRERMESYEDIKWGNEGGRGKCCCESEEGLLGEEDGKGWDRRGC